MLARIALLPENVENVFAATHWLLCRFHQRPEPTKQAVIA